ncbi:helix-turn-helix domain-containing protein [Patulibacter americanus]|uniref:helix-turn-helix domain-containing protein n=1 Tax=Patulibacter americanus TaxID=588672 RepID=UPI0003B3F0A6|nr:helix-turn-helix domain-containing protein [Patulibacter americanus]
MSTRRPRRRDEDARKARPDDDRRMTYDERDEAKRLWAAGNTVADIAKKMGRTVQEVSFVMHDAPPAEVRTIDPRTGRPR